MENNEHVTNETPESPKDENIKEPCSEEWNERQTATLEEQLNTGELVDGLGSVKETKPTEQPTKQRQSYLPNTMENSEHIKEETPESPKDENIKKTSDEGKERQEATSDEQLKAGRHETGSVQGTNEERIKQLTGELFSAYIANAKLKIHIWNLKQSIRYFADMARTKSDVEKREIEELRKKIQQLELELDSEKKKSKDIRQHLQEKGQLCSNDCALCCLLWICNEKLHKYPCGAHLRTMLTIEAERKSGYVENKCLWCTKFLFILRECEIVSIYVDENQDPWEKLMNVDEEKRAVIIGSVYKDKNKVGHCLVCDVEKRNSQGNGCLKIYDPQNDKSCETNEKDFRTVLLEKKVDAVAVFTINFKQLQKIIENLGQCIMHETSNNCETNHTGTNNNCMSRSLIPTESDEPKIIKLPGKQTATVPIKEPTTTKSIKEPTNTKSIKEPTTTKSIEEPTATKSIEEPTATKSIKEPTATESIKEPTAAKSIEEPTAAKSIEEPTTTELIEEPTATESIEEQTVTELL